MTWESASTGPHVSYLVLVEILLDDEPIYVHDGIGTQPWNGHDWLGVGAFGEISVITSGADLTATGVSLTLSGVPSAFRSELLNASSRGTPVNIYHAFVDEAAGEWALEPELAFVAIVDTARLVDGSSGEQEPTVSITLNLISAASYARRLTQFRRSNAHQQSLFAGDLFLEFTTDLRSGVTLPATGQDVIAINPGGGQRPNRRHEN